MLLYWIWYAQLGKLSCRQKWQLLQHFRDPEEIFHSDRDTFAQLEFLTEGMLDALEDKDLREAQQILEECAEKGIRLLTVADEAYPSRLRNTYDPPVLLYFIGELPQWNSVPAIGIVGTRKATPYGCTTALRYGEQIAACGALVVSGGADGIDSMAMWGALNAEKPVVGVLGCGVDVVYPKKNRELFEQVRSVGCLISEYPPRTEARSWHFPLRNRIISGISNGLLVVEAPEKSGALISARYAMEQGRDIFVVPGNVDSLTCAGSNALLQENAAPALSGWDVVKEYAPLFPGKITKATPVYRESKLAQQPMIPDFSAQKRPATDKKSIDKSDNSTYSVVNKPLPALNQDEQEVLAHIDAAPKHIDVLTQELSLPASTVKAILTRLAIKGLIVNQPGGRVSRK